MSSRVDTSTPNDLNHCLQSTADNPNPEDLNVTQSSILYLLHEATKLATPSNQDSLGVDGLCDRSKEETLSSSPTPSSQKGHNITNPVAPSSFIGSFSVLSSVHNSSPWDVMSLINLHCERLLRSERTHGDKDDPCTTNTTSGLELGSADMDAEPIDAMDCSSLPSSGLIETNTSALLPRGDLKVCDDRKCNVFCSIPHIIDGSDLLASGAEDKANAEMDAIEDLTELIAKNTDGAFHFGSSLVCEEYSENFGLDEQTTLPLAGEEKVELCDQTPSFQTEEPEGNRVNASCTSETLQSPSGEISSVDFTSYLLIEKDVNSNMCLSFNSCKNSELGDALVSNTTPVNTPQPETDLNNNSHPESDKDEKTKESEEAQEAPSTQPRWGNRRRTPRKQAHPARSPDPQDPEVQGVTFSMHTELDHNTDQCRLLITSNYSELCRRGRRGRAGRSRTLQSSQRTSSSEEDSDPASLSKKICASCCTKKTPLWRDAEDGTPLCNACGIRYKKYRVRCLQCWNIPRKEANSNSKCLKCGDLLASQNKRTGF